MKLVEAFPVQISSNGFEQFSNLPLMQLFDGPCLRYYDTFGGEVFCFSIWKSVTAVIRHPYINDINYSDKINNCFYFYHKNGI